jgi:low affinity Fe/Cu permease
MSGLERLSQWATRWAGSSWGFLAALGVIAAWALVGPLLGFSPSWLLTINTLGTLGTFVMVFLIQRSQNKDSLVIQTKLNELLAAGRGSNRLIRIEDLSEDEVRRLHDRYQELAQRAARGHDPSERTSVEHVRGVGSPAALAGGNPECPPGEGRQGR